MRLAPKRRAGVLALAAALAGFLAGGARAQSELPEPLQDVPAGPARIDGTVVHDERPEAAAGVEIVLYALAADGTPGSRRAESDEAGRFRFTGISADPGVVYLVGARHAGLPFPGDRISFGEGETERTLEVRISDPSEDPSKVAVVQSSVRVALASGDRLAVAEVHRLRNSSDRVYHVAAERRAGRRAPLHAELLPEAADFAMPLGLVPEGVVREGDDLRFWGPLYPGEQEISFRYDVPVEVGMQTLTKRFPSAAGRIRVFGAEEGPLVEAGGLARGESIEEQGLHFQAWEVEAPGAGFTTALRLRVPEMVSDADAVRLAESQLVLEVDDVTLRVQEQHRIEVDGTAVVRATGGGLLIELPLPPGAEDIRFSADANQLGLVRTDDGVGLVGPLRPGTHGVGLAYHLRSAPGGVTLERRFDRRLPLLRAFVADTGVAIEAQRLHRRRPVRDADRTYLIFEAFEVEPGETLGLTLAPLPPRRGSSRPALALALLLGVGCLGFMFAPLGGEAEAAIDDDEREAPAHDEREHLYASIRDLDHDHETGKLDDASWQTLREELRARAVVLLAEERATSPAGANTAPAAPAAACPSCGREPRPDDQFCSSCGAQLPGARA